MQTSAGTKEEDNEAGPVLIGSAGGGDEGEELPPEFEPDEEDDDKASPAVGFVTQARALLEDFTCDVEAWEELEPTMGTFYPVRRGDIFLGTGSKSITHRALRRVVAWLREQGHDVPRELADDCQLRLDYGRLILASAYNTTLFATWGYGRKALVGPHGRAIPLGSHHGDVRSELLAGRPLTRLVPQCTPADARSGKALTLTGMCRPFLWLPPLNLDLLLEGEVTVEGLTWEDGAPALEPPSQFMRLVPNG